MRLRGGGVRAAAAGAFRAAGCPACLLLVVALAGCSGAGSHPVRGSSPPPSTSVPSATATGGTTSAAPPAAPPAAAGGATSTGEDPAATATQGGPWATVYVGRFGGDPAVRALAEFIPARTEAVITNRPRLAAFVTLTGPRYRRAESKVIAAMHRKHLTLPRPARWAVVGISPKTSTATRVRACIWGPSGALLDSRTGAWAQPVTQRWYPQDVRMVRTGGTWTVDWVYDSDFSCAGAQ